MIRFFRIPELSTKTTDRIFLILAILLPLLWMGVIRSFSVNAGESGNDSFYHVAMAEEGPSLFCAKQFPHITFSIWNDHFADKELLYHFILCGIVHAERFLHLPGDPPFHIAAMFFLIFLQLAFVLALKRLQIRPMLILAFSLMLPLISPHGLFRYMMLRPHVLSVTLLLFLCSCLFSGSLKKRILLTFPVALIYTWSYSNPQFVLIPAAVFSFYFMKQDSWRAWGIFLTALCAFLLGLTLHPQFPNTFFIWKVQSFDALFGPVFSGNGNVAVTQMLPVEMMPPQLRWYLVGIPFWIFAYFVLLCGARVIVREKWKNLESSFKALGTLSVMFLCGTTLAQRAIEYAIPFTLLFGAVSFEKALRGNYFLPQRSGPLKFCFLLTLLTMLAGVWSSVLNIETATRITPHVSEIGKWMNQNLPPGAKVMNFNWGDFPAAFYVSRKLCYFWGMDPAFSYALNPKKANKIENLLQQPHKLKPSQLGALTETDYAFVLDRRTDFIAYLKKCGWETVYEGENGAVFKLRSEYEY